MILLMKTSLREEGIELYLVTSLVIGVKHHMIVSLAVSIVTAKDSAILVTVNIVYVWKYCTSSSIQVEWQTNNGNKYGQR